MWGMRKAESIKRADSTSVCDIDSHRSSTIVSSDGTSSLNSRANSQGSGFSSRMNSFNYNGANLTSNNDIITQTSFDTDIQLPLEPPSPMSSESSQSQSIAITTPVSEEPSTEPSDTQDVPGENEVESKTKRAVSPTILKWVDESRIEMERRRSRAETVDSEVSGLSQNVQESPQLDQENPGVLDTAANDLMLQRALQLSLQRVSPTFARTGSIDNNFAQWSGAENLLMGLGFGGPDLGIPSRFLQSWRQQMVKRQLQEIQNILGRPLGSLSPTESLLGATTPQVSPRDGRLLSSKPVSPPKLEKPKKGGNGFHKNSAIVSETQQHVTKSVMEPSEKQKQLEKLHEMRQKLKKSATFASFSQQQLASIRDPNNLSHHQNGKDSGKKRHDGRKHRHRGSLRGNARDKRRKFAARQSSLPTSLEPLPEEDETKPYFMHQKSSSLDLSDELSSVSTDVSDSNILMSLRSFDVGSNLIRPVHPQIITHPASDDVGKQPTLQGPSEESCKLESKQEIQDRKLAPGDEQGRMESFLQVIKGMIDSKDSGIGNDMSADETPDLSPNHDGAEEEMLVDVIETNFKKDEGFEESDSHEISSDFQSSCLGKTILPEGLGVEVRDVSIHVVKEFRSRLKNNTVEQSEVCIQVDMDPKDFDEDQEDIYEVTCASTQTSPWMHSPVLSPLCFVQEDDKSQNIMQDSTRISPSEKESVDNVTENMLRGIIISKIGKDEEILYSQEDGSVSTNDGSQSMSCLEKQNKQDMLFFPEKRRLSRIDEVTENSQSQESEMKSSIESQNDGSASTSSSHINNMMQNAGSIDRQNTQEGQRPTTQPKLHGGTRRKSKAYHEMLRQNVEHGMTEAEKMVFRKSNMLSAKWRNQLSVGETLNIVASKLRDIASQIDKDGSQESEQVKGQDIKEINLEVSSDDELNSDDYHRRWSSEVSPVMTINPKQVIASKSMGNSPDMNSGSRRARQFFYNNSLSSLTDGIRLYDERSRMNSLTSEMSDGSAFFGALTDFETLSQESGMNFSLTGSDMNLIDDDYVDVFSLLESSSSGRNSERRKTLEAGVKNTSQSLPSIPGSQQSFSSDKDEPIWTSDSISQYMSQPAALNKTLIPSRNLLSKDTKYLEGVQLFDSYFQLPHTKLLRSNTAGEIQGNLRSLSEDHEFLLGNHLTPTFRRSLSCDPHSLHRQTSLWHQQRSVLSEKSFLAPSIKSSSIEHSTSSYCYSLPSDQLSAWNDWQSLSESQRSSFGEKELVSTSLNYQRSPVISNSSSFSSQNTQQHQSSIESFPEMICKIPVFTDIPVVVNEDFSLLDSKNISVLSKEGACSYNGSSFENNLALQSEGAESSCLRSTKNLSELDELGTSHQSVNFALESDKTSNISKGAAQRNNSGTDHESFENLGSMGDKERITPKSFQSYQTDKCKKKNPFKRQNFVTESPCSSVENALSFSSFRKDGNAKASGNSLEIKPKESQSSTPRYVSEAFIYIRNPSKESQNFKSSFNSESENAALENNFSIQDVNLSTDTNYRERNGSPHHLPSSKIIYSVHSMIISKTFEVETTHSDINTQHHAAPEFVPSQGQQPFRYSSKYYLQLQQCEVVEEGIQYGQFRDFQSHVFQKRSFLNGAKHRHFAEESFSEQEGQRS